MVVEGDEGATPSPDFPGEKVGLGSWRAGRPPDLFGGKKAVPECKFPASAGRGRGGGEYSNFREKMIVGGAGGPDALQTSSEGRRRYQSVNFRLLRDAVRAEADIRTSERK